MPPQLTAVLAAVGAEASPAEFAAIESLLGGSLSGLAEIRRGPVARIDAVDLTGRQIRDRLAGLPIKPRAEPHVAKITNRLGPTMRFETFAANADDLWFPAMDDIVAVLDSGAQLMLLVLDHEELVTLSRVNPGGHAGQPPPPGRSQAKGRRVRDRAAIWAERRQRERRLLCPCAGSPGRREFTDGHG